MFLPNLKRYFFQFSAYNSKAFRFLSENSTGTLDHRDHDHEGWWDLLIRAGRDWLEEYVPMFASLWSVIWPNHFRDGLFNSSSNCLYIEQGMIV